MQLIEGSNDQDAASEAVPAQANSDDTLIALWLAGKADRTRRAYQDDVTAFLRFADKSLRRITLADLVAWGETL
jgi:integrase/recombinase XerD